MCICDIIFRQETKTSDRLVMRLYVVMEVYAMKISETVQFCLNVVEEGLLEHVARQSQDHQCVGMRHVAVPGRQVSGPGFVHWMPGLCWSNMHAILINRCAWAPVFWPSTVDDDN